MWWLVAGAQIATGLIANQKAKKAAEANAEYISMESAEQLRRMDRMHLFNVGEAQATIGARGLLLEGSQQKLLNEMQLEYERQRQWVVDVNLQRKRIARRSGQYVGYSQILQGISTAAQGAYGAFQTPNNQTTQAPTTSSNNDLNWNQRLT